EHVVGTDTQDSDLGTSHRAHPDTRRAPHLATPGSNAGTAGAIRPGGAQYTDERADLAASLTRHPTAPSVGQPGAVRSRHHRRRSAQRRNSAYLARARERELDLRSSHAVGTLQPVCYGTRSASRSATVSGPFNAGGSGESMANAGAHVGV